MNAYFPVNDISRDQWISNMIGTVSTSLINLFISLKQSWDELPPCFPKILRPGSFTTLSGPRPENLFANLNSTSAVGFTKLPTVFIIASLILASSKVLHYSIEDELCRSYFCQVCTQRLIFWKILNFLPGILDFLDNLSWSCKILVRFLVGISRNP